MTYYRNTRRQVESQTADLSSLVPGPVVDNGVLAITRDYDDLGRPTLVTSHSTAQITPNSTDVVNQVKYTRDTFRGQLTKTEQDHSGTVGGTEPKVQYTYDFGGGGSLYINGLRKTTVTYPGGGSVADSFSSSNSINDRLGRIATRTSNLTSPKAINYQYNGTGRLVETKYATPDVHQHADRNGDGNYAVWDRFGRTIQTYWRPATGTNPPYKDRFKYTYDYAGNRTSRNNLLTTGSSNVWDQNYDYDGLHRLKGYRRGTLSGSGTTISGKKEASFWTLDQLGNWSRYRHDANGNGSYTGSADLDQNRLHNSVNEIDNDNDHTNAPVDVITEASGSNQAAWIDPAHDAAGNMTTIPKPKDLTNGYTAKYDAWNRLVELKEGSTVKQTNTYDGLNRRIKRVEPTKTRHFYYNENWQVLTESDGTNATAIYSYHPHYIDAVAARMEPTTGHFYLHDANFNVTAAVDINQSTKPIVERYHYSPYGEVTYLNADFSKKTTQSSAIGNELLFTGRRLDPETGLQLNRNRFYHARLGRWVSVDPIGYGGSGYNLFEYVGGMPTYYIDPYGERAWSCVVCACCFGTAGATCGALCAGGHWDKPGESFGSCFKKCIKASLGAKVFSTVCLVACGSCAGKVLKGKLPKKKPPKRKVKWSPRYKARPLPPGFPR